MSSKERRVERDLRAHFSDDTTDAIMAYVSCRAERVASRVVAEAAAVDNAAWQEMMSRIRGARIAASGGAGDAGGGHERLRELVAQKYDSSGPLCSVDRVTVGDVRVVLCDLDALRAKLAEAERVRDDARRFHADEHRDRLAAEAQLARYAEQLATVRKSWSEAQAIREQTHREHGREHDHGYARALESVGTSIDRILAALDAPPEQPKGHPACDHAWGCSLCIAEMAQPSLRVPQLLDAQPEQPTPRCAQCGCLQGDHGADYPCIGCGCAAFVPPPKPGESALDEMHASLLAAIEQPGDKLRDFEPPSERAHTVGDAIGLRREQPAADERGEVPAAPASGELLPLWSRVRCDAVDLGRGGSVERGVVVGHEQGGMLVADESTGALCGIYPASAVHALDAGDGVRERFTKLLSMIGARIEHACHERERGTSYDYNGGHVDALEWVDGEIKAALAGTGEA